MLLHPSHPLPLKRFHFDKAKESLSAMESDLRTHAFDGTYPWLCRLYDDACDVGMFIESELTGRILAFALTRTETNEGDVLCWHFTPVNKLANVRNVVIFND